MQQDGAGFPPPGNTSLGDVDERWRRLFDQMSEGFIMGDLLRDAGGAPVDWRGRHMNDAAQRLTEAMRGSSARGGDPQEDWLLVFAGAAASGETGEFERHVPALRRWFRGRYFPTGTEGFGMVFRDVTGEVRQAARQATLLELGDRLRECGSVPEMTRVASEMVGRALEATRASYGHVDAATEIVDIEPGWTAEGVSHIAGRHRFEDYGRLRDPLERGEPLVIDDVVTDPLTSDDPRAMLALGIRALVNMPVREHGRTVAVFIVQKVERYHWSADELGFLRKVADRLQIGAARLQAEEQQRIVNGEIAHRLKNQLAVVQAVASQTLRHATDLGEAQTALSARLIALARATDVLMSANWAGAELHELARIALETHKTFEGRVRLAGPRIRFDAQIALALALALYELATNAAKYGALGNDAGGVDLNWAVVPGTEPGTRRFHLCWRESGGPPVREPTRRGFGSAMIERSLRTYFRGETRISYPEEGVRFVIDAPFVGELV